MTPGPSVANWSRFAQLLSGTWRVHSARSTKATFNLNLAPEGLEILSDRAKLMGSHLDAYLTS